MHAHQSWSARRGRSFDFFLIFLAAVGQALSQEPAQTLETAAGQPRHGVPTFAKADGSADSTGAIQQVA